jgi:Bacterial pre-peptidase C-terminal domain
MRRLLAIAVLAIAAAGCGPKAGSKQPKDNFDADAKSGPDQKRSSAQKLDVNRPRTDEVSYANQDRTDWYEVELKGKSGVLTTLINWDNASSDVNIDVFDAFGAQIAASPVRGKGEKQKKLFTQIDKPGTYFIRVTAPTRADGTVYTMEAQWEEPAAVAVTPQPPAPQPEPLAEERPTKRTHVPREPREPKERPAGETIQARVVSAYREGAALMMYIDKGSAAGIRPGDAGVVLQGSGGEDPLDGGNFKIVKVIDANKCVGSASLRSLGKNNRVAITLSR